MIDAANPIAFDLKEISQSGCVDLFQFEERKVRLGG